MTIRKYGNPFALVASALKCKPNDLTMASGWGHSPPEWDSFGQTLVLVALEEEYDIVIDDQEVNQFRTMAQIVEFHKQRVANREPGVGPE